MASNVTQTTIANRALQLLGYEPIASINDNNRGARAVNRAYYPVLYSELRSNYWGFAMQRATLVAAANQPAFGPASYFNLPPDFLDLGPPDQIETWNYGLVPYALNGTALYTNFNDYKIENNNGVPAIVSNQGSPLYIRYMSSNVTESAFDTCFAEAFAASLAMEICEELTQSNTKMQTAQKMYDDAIQKAKQRNAFETKPVQAPVDRYITVRR